MDPLLTRRRTTQEQVDDLPMFGSTEAATVPRPDRGSAVATAVVSDPRVMTHHPTESDASTGDRSSRAATLSPPPSDPRWCTQPRTPLEQHFVVFHHRNPHIFRELLRQARHALERGEGRVSIALLTERIRADLDVSTSGDSYKMDNRHRAYYARLLIHHEPRLAGVLHTRAVQGEAGEGEA